MTLTLHIQQPGEWRPARDLRIAMLADTPIAYVDTLERAQARSDAEWELRYRVRLGDDWRAVAVVDGGGTWRGQMLANVDGTDPTCAWLLAVWLHPDYRGTGAAAAMLDDIVAWGRARGLCRFRLEVHESNARAIAFYRRYGFIDTGGRRPYPLEPTTFEVEMRLDLEEEPPWQNRGP